MMHAAFLSVLYSVSSSANRQSGGVIRHCWRIIIQFVGPTLLWLHFFFWRPTTINSDSGEAQLSLVFLVDTFKVFPYSISGVINSLFLMILEYTVYSVCFCCFCGQQLSCNSDAFWLIAVLLHGLYSVILIKPTLRRAAGSLCNLWPHSKIVQLNKMNNIASPKGSVPPNYKKTCFLLLLVIFKHADSWDFEKSF